MNFFEPGDVEFILNEKEKTKQHLVQVEAENKAKAIEKSLNERDMTNNVLSNLKQAWDFLAQALEEIPDIKSKAGDVPIRVRGIKVYSCWFTIKDLKKPYYSDYSSSGPLMISKKREFFVQRTKYRDDIYIDGYYYKRKNKQRLSKINDKLLKDLFSQYWSNLHRESETRIKDIYSDEYKDYSDLMNFLFCVSCTYEVKVISHYDRSDSYIIDATGFYTKDEIKRRIKQYMLENHRRFF